MGKFSKEECEVLEATIDRLHRAPNLNARDAELILGRVLEPLLQDEGYDLEHTGGPGDNGIDFKATRCAGSGALTTVETVGIQAKLYRNSRRVPMSDVQSLIGAALLQDLNRVVLVSNGEFSEAARNAVGRELPLRIELLDIEGLRSWVSRLRNDNVDVETEVRVMMRDLSGQLARLIASQPAALMHLEWRDVERVVAEVFDGLGFGVELTPGSKDGGKDVILTCTVNGKRAEYYVEIKHWRSATRFGSAAIERLLKVIVKERKDGGLFLSTYGFTENAFEQLTAIEKQKLKFGDKEKIVAFCQSYIKAKSGLWSPPEDLTDILLSSPGIAA
ncbi:MULTISPECIES: restriction endonuclease [unclassified Burkholderia]|uniref:restriction endonuclease n=1 Tax=unclassified Burkholderia TaxID=2613784 RepID=UPI00214F64DC|nr:MULTISPECIES: restriction endonuclease [unclassified Burkholderia]MCR4469849.1 restriction endonuclease [Burkholderia sp. SCN-KJ]